MSKKNNFISRFKTLKKGPKRLLLVLSIIIPVFLTPFIDEYGPNNILDYYFDYFDEYSILFISLSFIGFWIAVGIALWIIEGFKEIDND